jgi:hypothetical protein
MITSRPIATGAVPVKADAFPVFAVMFEELAISTQGSRTIYD